MSEAKYKTIVYRGGYITVTGTARPINSRGWYKWFSATCQMPATENEYRFDVTAYSEKGILTCSKQVFDWLLENEHKMDCWGGYTGDKDKGGLGITLYRNVKHARCSLPYAYTVSAETGVSTMRVHPLGGEAVTAGWHRAIELSR